MSIYNIYISYKRCLLISGASEKSWGNGVLGGGKAVIFDLL
jgi:hypothetical protein